MEKKGQYVRLSAISQGGRPCSAPGLVTRGYEECQGPVWSPGGQLPYEYFKIKKKNQKKKLFFIFFFSHVACKLLTKPPPPHCPAEAELKPGHCRGQSASLALPSFGYRQGF